MSSSLHSPGIPLQPDLLPPSSTSATCLQRSDPEDFDFAALQKALEDPHRAKWLHYDTTAFDGHNNTHATIEKLNNLITGIELPQTRLGVTRTQHLFVPTATPIYRSKTYEVAWQQRIHTLCHAAEQLLQPSLQLPVGSVVPEMLATWYAKIVNDNHEQHIHPRPEVVYHLMVGPTEQLPPLLRKPSVDMSNVHLFSDSLAFCYSMKGSKPIDIELKRLPGEPWQGLNVTVTRGMTLGQACDQVESCIGAAAAKGQALMEMTILVNWNGSEYLNDASALLALSDATLASAARLAALLKGVGRALVVGFVPSWRWSMPVECDAYNTTVRGILTAAGIMTWNGQLLQSLLMPYCLVNPKSGSVNNYHHRVPDQDLDLGWIWDSVLRAALRYVYAIDLGDAWTAWPEPLEVPCCAIGRIFNPIADPASVRDWPASPRPQ